MTERFILDVTSYVQSWRLYSPVRRLTVTTLSVQWGASSKWPRFLLEVMQRRDFSVRKPFSNVP